MSDGGAYVLPCPPLAMPYVHRENFRGLSKICENRKTFLSLNFCRLRFFLSENIY